MPLYDILNEFQKGSHMAVVVRECNDKEHSAADQQNEEREVKVDIFCEPDYQGKCLKKKRSIKKLKDLHGGDVKEMHKAASKSRKWAKDFHSDILHFSEDSLPKLAKEGEAIGIITLEDVIEEILKKEISDETDYVAKNHISNSS